MQTTMKNIFKFFVLALASMAALASCAKNEVFTETKELKTVQVVAKHGDTKTTLEEGKYVRWSTTDAVKAYGYLDNYVSTSTVVSDGGATATFTFSTGEDEIEYMIYPASGAGELENNDWIGVTIPTEQTAVANGFADGANVAIGEYVDGAADFYSIGALVSFDIKNDDITSIKLECPAADCAVTGKGTAKIDEENYYGIGDEITEVGTANYVVLKAAAGQTLTKGAKYFAVVYADEYTGMKLTFTRNDGKTATFTNSKELKLDINANYTIFNAEIPDSKWVSPISALFYESFDTNDGTGGNDGQWSGSIAANNLESDNQGWTFVSGKGAYKCAKFGAGSTKGSATTPEIKCTGNVDIKFKAAAWNGGSEGTTLVLSSTSGELSETSVTLVKAAWSEYTVTLTSATNPKITFSANVATNNRFFLDEVIVVPSTAPVKYKVTCEEVTGGTISADIDKAVAGTTITLTATSNPGYEFESWNVSGATVADATSATTTFTMPAADVNVSATFKAAAIPNKTIAEFIAAEGGNCYLTGVVSNIVNTTYGNFDLTDDSGEIFIYGCLTSEGVARQFSTLGIEEGDRIKVLASEYEFHNNEIHEAKNVVFVEIVQKAPFLKATANKTSGIAAAGETITVTVDTNVEGWTASSDNAAFAISGNTATSFNVVVSANTTTSERTAKITVSATGVAPVEITLKQDKSGGKTKDNTAKYTLNPSQGSNNSYTGNCDVTVKNITWNVSGNSQQIPWRLGGRNISKVDRTVYSKTAYSKELWKVSLTVGAASSITVNSLKLVYSTNANFSDSKEIAGTFKANSTIDFEAEFPANCYYKFVFNVTVSGSSNKFVEFSKVEFFGYQGE